MALCRHGLFVEDPHKAWAFHGPMLDKFRRVQPHEGFGQLLDLCRAAGEYFVATSNIDGEFEAAGFGGDRVFAAHGSVHQWQCVDPKCRGAPWPVDPEWTFVPGRLPQCRTCGKVARPNVALFDDDLGQNARSFNSRLVDKQKAAFCAWLQRVEGRRLAIIEIGCGENEYSLRMARKDGRWSCMSGEWKLPPLACPLVRIDPEYGGVGDAADFVHIRAGAQVALTRLAGALRGAGARGSAASLPKGKKGKK